MNQSSTDQGASPRDREVVAIVAVVDRPLGSSEFQPLDAALLGHDVARCQLRGSLETEFVQMGWMAQECAGMPVSALLSSKAGVYLSICQSSEHPGLANALSRFYDIKGPSLQWDVQSGGLLLAIGEAVHALRRGACDQALAGGFTSEGRAVLMLLAPLSRALALGLPVDAVLAGSVVQHEGRGPLSDLERCDLRERAWADAEIDQTEGALPEDGQGVDGLLDVIRQWNMRPPVDADAPVTQRACVRNNGEGGCHVYLVLQHGPVVGQDAPAAGLQVVPLSAPGPRQLKVLASQLLASIQVQAPDFARLVHTLQLGRDGRTARVAFVAGNLAELARLLDAFISGGSLPEGCHCGEVDRTGGGLPRLMVADADAQAMVSHWLAKGKHDALAALWVTGVDLDWGLGGAADAALMRRRIHLPGHVFSGSAALEPERSVGLAGVPAFAQQDIAIVGLSGRFPGAANIHAFWQRLVGGENCAREVPSDRWDWKAYHSEQKGQWGAIYNKWGGFIDRIDCFDPLFFNISPLEAENMDPQERIFLEEAYACVADAGYTPATLSASRKVGVFVAVMNSAYSLLAEHWSIANRVSSVFNLNGPSLAIDTACSSSLTALHYACESLHRGHSECAIVGGISLIVDPVQYMRVSERTMVSSGEACRSFGAEADGFVEAEGVGAVLIKPLFKAIADGDQVYGVIKATAINHGGKTRGYYVPSSDAQADVIAQAIDESGCHPRSISYIEAHGTGTLRGDPIEIEGLRKAFRRYTDDTQFCAIGSVKSNMGHCESAAGMAGLAKLLLQLRHQTLVKSLYSESLNPRIDFQATPFVVQQCNAPWMRPTLDLDGILREYPRRAGLSSFGAGGSNAHVVIEEHVHERANLARSGAVLVVLSAANVDRLQEQVEQLRAYIDSSALQDEHLHDLAYTLQVGREALAARAAWIVGSISVLRAALAGETVSEYRGVVVADESAMGFFAADNDMRSVIDAWLRKGKLDCLAQAWIRGIDLDWSVLHGRCPPQRMSLPTYPFAQERYWSRRTIGLSPAPLPAMDAVAKDPVDGPLMASFPAPGSTPDAMLAFIVKALSEMLNIPEERIETSRALLDYGMDSVVGMRLIQRIESAYPVRVGGRDLFEHVTAEALAVYLNSKIGIDAASTADRPSDDAVLARFEQGQLNMDEVHRMLGLQLELK